MDAILLEAIERYTGQGYELETLASDGVATLATVQSVDAGARVGRTLRLVRYAGFGAVAVVLVLVAVAVFRRRDRLCRPRLAPVQRPWRISLAVE